MIPCSGKIRVKASSCSSEARVASNTERPARYDATVTNEIESGDKYFLSEHYDDAAACYRAALKGAAGDAELTAKLERASASAATGLAAGEQQREVFRDLFSRDRLLAGPDLLPAAETPPLLGPRRTGISALAHNAFIKLAQGAGAIGSFV